mgnify:CR=1 FL=1
MKHELLLKDIQTPESLVEGYPELFTTPQVNWLLKTRHKNGLADTGAVLKISRKLYIHTPMFMAWFMKQKA